MRTEKLAIALDAAQRVSALVYLAADADRSSTTLILAHGAGAGQHHPFMVDFARGLSDRGVDVVTFDFPYMERGRRVPDHRVRLEACYRTVIETVCSRVRPDGRTLFIGGKSMGGRMATYVAAAMGEEQRAVVRGVVLLGYPLHPPGRPDRLRADHLAAVGIPMLFVQGSRDAFGTPDELREQLAGIADVEICPVEGGDHSFRVPKRSGRSVAQVHAGIQDAIVTWMTRNSDS